jgi:serine/threonine-protein kinase
LQKAHEARVIHRDIKPANLFLAKLGENRRKVKLLDFGVAKIKLETVGVDTSGLTRTGSMLGSPLYMSPEQARGQKIIDSRADIWSLGVCLYQALTGRRPHQDIDGLGELIIAICSELPQPVQELAPWVPSNVAAIVHGALQFAPEDRFQTATSMLDAITAELADGYAITDEMLSPISTDEKSKVMPKLASIEMGASSRTVVRSSDAPVDDAAKTVAYDPPAPAASVQAAQTLESAHAPPSGALETKKIQRANLPAPEGASQTSSLRLLWIVLGLLLVVAAAAFAMKEMQNPPHRPAPAQHS